MKEKCKSVTSQIRMIEIRKIKTKKEMKKELIVFVFNF